MIKDLKKCCGCGTCREICPRHCIAEYKDDEGFCYPKVDLSRCIDCGLCDTICPQQNHAGNKSPSCGYIAFSKDSYLRETGSSGGIFGNFASFVIKNGGVVFGAGLDENLQLKQYCIDNQSDLQRIYKSKYIQCDMSGFYKKVKNEVKTGRYVLVCNTPCNISALKKYLSKDYPNLILVDFVCHGVPSQDFFDKCIKWYADWRSMEITGYTFRKKTVNAPTPHLFEIEYKKNGKLYRMTDLYLKDPFYNAFQKRLSIRPSCYKCLYAEDKRVADITIGDFHDVEKIKKGYDRMAGVSMVLINSEKGIKFFELIKPSLDVCTADTDVLINNNECLKSATVCPDMREEFFKHLRENGVQYLMEHELNGKADWKMLIYYKMPKALRKMLKRIILGGK